MKQEFLADETSTFKHYIYQNNAKAVPSAATMDVYKPGNTTKYIDGVTMDIAADGLLSYGLSADNNDVADENYKVVISYTLGGVVYKENVYYDVVLSILSMVIIDDDLLRELPQLQGQGRSHSGTSTAGSTTTMTDLELQKYPDDFWNGGTAYSATQDEEREITNFVSSTGVVTFDAFPADAATDEYILRRSYLREIERAFDKIKSRIIAMGKRPFLVLDPNDLYEVHVMLAVAEVCKGLATDRDSFHKELQLEYEEKYAELWKDLNFKYDFSEDSYLSGAEESAGNEAVRLVRG